MYAHIQREGHLEINYREIEEIEIEKDKRTMHNTTLIFGSAALLMLDPQDCLNWSLAFLSAVSTVNWTGDTNAFIRSGKPI